VDGKLHDIRVISGSSLLSGAAVAAAEQWRYSPARLHGNVVESQATIDINFTLDN
jgi:membrane protein involved in colicin uptake